MEVDPAAGEALLQMAADRMVAKVRHRVGRWEIDVFGGSLEGLIAAEVELERPDEPLPRPPPGLRPGPEVTDEGRWTNQALAHLSPERARARVEEARARIEAASADVEGADRWTP